MYKEFRKELQMYLLERLIINIYVFDGKEVQKVVIGQDGYDKDQIKFKSTGFEVLRGPITTIWYSYANIQKIEVFGYEYQSKNNNNG